MSILHLPPGYRVKDLSRADNDGIIRTDRGVRIRTAQTHALQQATRDNSRNKRIPSLSTITMREVKD